MEYIPFSSGGTMRVGSLVRNTHNLKLGIVIGLDGYRDYLAQVVSENGTGWTHIRYLEVICE